MIQSRPKCFQNAIPIGIGGKPSLGLFAMAESFIDQRPVVGSIRGLERHYLYCRITLLCRNLWLINGRNDPGNTAPWRGRLPETAVYC